MRPHKITIIDVAKEAGVSVASVSRFINNPACLRKDNREKIDAAVKKLNYQPLVYAQRLAGGKLDTFGLIIPGYEGIFYSFYASEIIRNIGQALEKTGIDLHLNIFWNKDNFKVSLVDGVIFADVINNQNQLARIIKKGLPVVVINKKILDEGISFVSIDNFKGGYEATDFLIKHGHKRIVHIAGDLNVQCAQDRLDGYRQALQKNGIPLKNEYVKVANFSRMLARSALEELFASSPQPTAIFCASDDMAQETLYFARERGLKVPEQLSIIGFDDNPHCVYDNFSLTTVRQPLAKMVHVAVDILRELIEKGGESSRQITLSPELIVRDTVGFI